MEVIVIAIIIGLIPAYIAKSKGREFFSWWLYGALLFIIALIHSILLKNNILTESNNPEDGEVSAISQTSSKISKTTMVYSKKLLVLWLITLLLFIMFGLNGFLIIAALATIIIIIIEERKTLKNNTVLNDDSQTISENEMNVQGKTEMIINKTQMHPYVKYGIIIGVMLLLTLPLHYIPAHLKVFPKDNFTFSNTLIFQSDIDNLIKRYNSSNLYERVSISNEYLFQKLKEKELITISDESNFNNNNFNGTTSTTTTDGHSKTEDNSDNYSEADKKILAKIKAKIIRDFPEDYFTQKMMYDQEVDAYFYMKTVTDLKIKKKVEREFPLEFFTQKMMYNQEIDAKEQMK